MPQFLLGGANGFAAYGQNELLTEQYYSFQSGYLVKFGQASTPARRRSLYLNGTFEGRKGFRAAVQIASSR